MIEWLELTWLSLSGAQTIYGDAQHRFRWCEHAKDCKLAPCSWNTTRSVDGGTFRQNIIWIVTIQLSSMRLNREGICITQFAGGSSQSATVNPATNTPVEWHLWNVVQWYNLAVIISRDEVRPMPFWRRRNMGCSLILSAPIGAEM